MRHSVLFCDVLSSGRMRFLLHFTKLGGLFCKGHCYGLFFEGLATKASKNFYRVAILKGLILDNFLRLDVDIGDKLNLKSRFIGPNIEGWFTKTAPLEMYDWINIPSLVWNNGLVFLISVLLIFQVKFLLSVGCRLQAVGCRL